MSELRLRAIRGATTVDRDTPEEIHAATRELLAAISSENGLDSSDVVSAIFTTTADITSEFPALAARAFGWVDVPLLCTMEIPVPGSLGRCIRVLLHVETTRRRDQLRHIYLRDAKSLRPDLHKR